MLQLQRSFCDGRECGEAPEEVADTCRVACARASSRQEGQGDDEEAVASGTGRPQGRGGGARPSSAGLVGTKSGPHLGQFYVRTTAHLSLCDQGLSPPSWGVHSASTVPASSERSELPGAPACPGLSGARCHQIVSPKGETGEAASSTSPRQPGRAGVWSGSPGSAPSSPPLRFMKSASPGPLLVLQSVCYLSLTGFSILPKTRHSIYFLTAAHAFASHAKQPGPRGAGRPAQVPSLAAPLDGR